MWGNSYVDKAYWKGVARMTEKRFTYMIDRVFDLWGVYDNKEKVICLVRNTDAKDLCDLLNELQEKNEQLKSTINTLTHDNTKMKKVLNTTKNENEQIKQVIKEAYNNERTHIGKNTLKQLMEAIQ